MGISLFGRKSKAPPRNPAPIEGPAGPAPAQEGPERLTANEWAKKHAINEVAAERAAMHAGRWHDRFTEQEFLELIRRHDV